jgi:CHAT domain-containing protein/Tol biopolymer transport system component
MAQSQPRQPVIPALKPQHLPHLPVFEPSQLTARVNPVLGFTVSPKGARLAVTSSSQDFAAIWVQSGDPHHVQLPSRLLPTGGDHFQPAFLPDGSGLVFSGTDHDVKGDLFRIDIKASDTKPIRLTNRETSDRAPCLSPNGKKIYFHQSRPGQHSREIAILNLEHRNMPVQRLAISRDAAYPAISPNAQLCAFVSAEEGCSSLFLFNLENNTFQRLTKGDFCDQDPCWSENGTYVYFSRCLSSGECSIWRIAVNTKEPTAHPVTSGSFTAKAPKLAGGRLYFLSDKSGIENVWHLPPGGQIPIQETAEAQIRLAEDIENLYPPDLNLTALAYQKVREAFSDQKQIAAEALLRAARIYERQEHTQYARLLYEDCMHEMSVQPQAGLAAIRLEILKTREDWTNKVTISARREVIQRAQMRLESIADDHTQFSSLLAESRLEQAALLIDLGGQPSDLVQALNLLDLVLKDNSIDQEQRARALFIKAKVFDRVGRDDEVIPAYASILEHYPEVKPWADRAIQRILDFQISGADQQTIQEQIRILRRIAETYRTKLPRLAMGAHNRLGDVYFASHEWAKAKAAYRHVLEGFSAKTSTQYAAARLSLAEILYQEERFYEALQLYEMEMSVRTFEDYLYRLAWNGYIRKNLEAAEYHFGLGEISRAKTLFVNLLRKDPTLVEAHRGYIKSAAAQKNIGPALQAYRQQLKEDPKNPVLLYCTGLCLTYLEDEKSLNQARKLISSALRLKGQVEFFHQTLGYIYEVLETVHGEQGRLELALDHYRKAYFLNNPEQNPRNRAHLLLNLGNVSFLLGHYEQAFANYHLRQKSQVSFQDKDTELIFFRRFAQSAFLSKKGQEPVKALAKGLDLIDNRLQPKKASIILGRLHRSIKERILLPAKRQGVAQDLVQNLFERQSKIQADLFRASRQEISPPPDPSWEIYKTTLQPIVARQHELINDLGLIGRQIGAQNWDVTQQNMVLMLKKAKEALQFPVNLRMMQAEMLDRLGLAYQEIDQWGKARQHFLAAFELNKQLGQTQNLAPNRRSAGYNAYLQATKATGEKQRRLLKLALTDFKEVLDLVERHGVPSLKKEQRKKGLISISLDIALEKQTATQAQYGFSAVQEKRLARAFISRIQTELSRFQPARQAANEQLQSYPSGKAIPDKDIFGVSLLLHRSAHLERAGNNLDLACQRFLRSAELALKMDNPLSSAVNVSNAAYLLAQLDPEVRQAEERLSALGRLDQKTGKLLAEKARLVGSLARAGYHNQMGVAWSLLAMHHKSNDVHSVAQATSCMSQAGSHLYHALKILEQETGSQRSHLSLRAALHLNLADLADWDNNPRTAKVHFQKALDTASKGRLACFEWRALAGLGKFEQAAKVLFEVPLFERGCGPGEVVHRLAPLVFRPARQEKPEEAFHVLEQLSELERVQRMTQLIIGPLSDEARDALRTIGNRLQAIKDLQTRLEAAPKVDQEYLLQRLQQEQHLLESALVKEQSLPLSLLQGFRTQERRDVFLELAGLSAVMLHLAEQVVQETETSHDNHAVQAYEQTTQTYVQTLNKASSLLGPGSPAGLLGLLVPQPVQAADVAAVLPQGGRVIRLLPRHKPSDAWLSIVLTPTHIDFSQWHPDQDLQTSDSNPYIVIFEDPSLFGSIPAKTLALSGTHLVRSIDMKKPFKKKVLAYPETIGLQAPFEELSLDTQDETNDMVEQTERSHCFVADTTTGQLTTVPTRQGQLPTAYPGIRLDSGQDMNLIQLADRLDNVSLAILNRASPKDAYILGHLLCLFGVPTVLVPHQRPGSQNEVREFFNHYSKGSVTEALQALVEYKEKQQAPWLHLGHWGLTPKESSILARQQFTTHVQGAVEAYKTKDYHRALVLFENGLLIVNQTQALSHYKAKLLEYARESAFAAGALKQAAKHAGDLSRYWSAHRPDSQAQAQALLKQGLVLSRLERFDQAIPCLQQAIDLLSALDLPLQRIQALSDLGTVLENATEYDLALQGYQSAASLSQEIGATELLARQHMSIGRIYDLRLSRYALAKEYYHKAEQIFQDLNQRTQVLQSRLDIARCDRLLGRFDRTEAILTTILEEAQTLPETTRLQTKIILEQANAAWFQARYQKAFNLLQQCLEQARKNNWFLEQVIALNTSGLTWWTLGKNERSLRDLQRALEIAKSLEIRRDEVATTYNNIGLVQRDQHKFEQALKTLNQALAIDKQIGSRWAIAYDLRNIGLTHIHSGDPQKALPLLKQALSLSVDIGNTVNQAKVLVALANCHFQSGDNEQARDHFKHALSLSRQMALRETIWRSLYGLGRIDKQKGNLAEARIHFLEALDVIENMRSEIDISQLRDSFVVDKMEVYEALVSVLLNMGRKEEAFFTAERSRARNLIDLLGNQQLRLGQGTEQKLYDQMASLKASILEQEQLVAQTEDKEASRIYRKTLDDLEDRYKDLLLQIQTNQPELASLITVDPLSAHKVIDLLDPGVILLSYYLLPQEIVCWVLKANDMHSVRIPVDRGRVDNLVIEFRRTLQNLEPYETRNQELSSLLLEPVAHHLKQAQQIGIIPHRILHYLSFAPLTYGGSSFVETSPLFYLPSASVLRYTLPRRRTENSPQVLAVGNPALETPQLELPFAEHEVQSIGWNFSRLTKLMREEATESWLVDNVHRFNVVHIASHGTYEPLNPLFSSLKLSQDPYEDGDLKASEIFGLNIEADMVVLSACQSGLGEIRAGDEVVGLNRAFMFAGTHALVSSLWRVSDITTAILMKQFYREYNRASKAASLQRAMLHVRNYYPHPGYWAAFILTGDYF